MTPIKLGNQRILQVRNKKFLGIYIDDELEWGDHINHITKKIASGAYALQAVKRYLCLDNMKSLYHSLVHSHLTYGTILWGSAFKYRLHKVEILQKKAIRNTCNTVYNAPTAPLFKQLGIAKLIDVYNIQLCKLMYSYTSGTLLTPPQTMFTRTQLSILMKLDTLLTLMSLLEKRALLQEHLSTNVHGLGWLCQSI